VRSARSVTEDLGTEFAITDYAADTAALVVVASGRVAVRSALVEPGRASSLSQTLLTLTSPGCPDVYQGTELWDLSLVDPDNRRPVDYDERRSLLAKVSQAPAADALALADEGAPKLWLVHRGLEVRRSHAAAFAPGSSYEPLAAGGEKAGHVVAYVRGAATARVAVVVPRLMLGLGGDWGDTTVALPEGRWTDVLGGPEVGGGRADVGALLSRFPVALLVAG
jgi:(1->4)-alpha-D-glucan 1-alpha-D-glucosylmutase